VTRFLAITGTDTEVGKTVVTAALAALARERGLRVAVVKPIQTGVEVGEPGDLEAVRRLSGVQDLHELARFSDPLAPATAARRSGSAGPSLEEIAAAIEELADRDLVLVEGAGGLLVRLEGTGATLADLAARLRAGALVVVPAGLGTLNATALTCEALRSRAVPCLGLVVGSWPERPDLAARCNLEDLPDYASAPLLGWLPAGAASLDPAAFLEVARAGLAGVLDAALSPVETDG
jgi:dethiobiotin synthetase